MASAADIVKIGTLTGETDTELLGIVLDDAQEFVLAYTGRTVMRSELEKTVRDLAVIALNRLGTQGESSRSEAGESYSFDDLPVSIERTLNRWRLARAGGKTHEFTT